MKIIINLSILFIILSKTLYCQDQKFVDSLLTRLELAESDTAKVRVYIKLIKYLNMSDPAQAEKYLQSAYYLSIKSDYKQGQADAYTYMGIFAKRKGDFNLALENNQKSLNLYREINNTKGIVFSLNNTALVYLNQCNYRGAMENFFNALELLETYNNPESKVLIYSNLAKLYLDIGLNDEAMGYLGKAEKNCQQYSSGNGLFHTYSMMGDIYYNENNMDKAETYYNLSLELCKKVNNKLGLSSVLTRLGNVSMTKGDMAKASEYIATSLQLIKGFDDKLGLIRSMDMHSKYLYYAKDYGKAEAVALECFRMGKGLNFQEGVSRSAWMLSTIYSDLGQFKKAFYYKMLYDSISENIFGSNKVYRIVVLKYQFEQEREKYQLQLGQQKKKMNNMIVFLTGFSLLLLFIMLYFFQRNKIRHFNLQEEYLNRELASKAIFLAKKDEVFAKIESILQDNESNFVKENQGAIQHILGEVRMAQDEEVWKEFELYFTGVHKDFYKNLDEKFPALSSNERRLCALLRMNMNTKDISSVTHQTAHSIDIARTRLRKKIGLLNKKESLYSFLSQL